MKRILNHRGLVLFMGLLLCSCATENPVHPRLPADVIMNDQAGRGGLLIVPFRLADGEELPLVVDTGAAATVLDKSLEPKLGERLDTGTLLNFGIKQDAGVYAEPRLYLGDVPLQTTGTNCFTFDRQKLADHNWPAILGMIGMDVLQNYCIQLDFAAGRLRFLDSGHADRKNWGEPFPLTDIGDGCVSVSENLAGVQGRASLIDTGCDASGWLQPEVYRQWTNQASSAEATIHAPDGGLGGEKYHDLHLRALDANSVTGDDEHIKINGIGLRALAENLVTFDFPHRTMYLKHINDWPLEPRDLEAEMISAEKSSLKPFKQLLKTAQLPGMSKDDHGTTTAFHFNHVPTPYLDTATWDALKKGDASIYHYTFIRTSKNGPWKLQKAWRTDQNGHTTKEYPIP